MTQNAIATINKTNSLVNVDMADLEGIAKWAVSSGMFSDIKTVSQGGMKILAGKELGLPPMASLTSFHFIKGRVVPSADLMASLIKQSGKYNYRVLEHTEKVCTIEFWELFNGSWQKMGVPVSYTEADMKREGSSSKETYQKFTDDMFFAACIRKGVRRYCPDITKGAGFMNVPESDYVEADFEHREFADDAEVFETLPPEILDGEVIEEDISELIERAEALIELKLTDEKLRKSVLKGKVPGLMSAGQLNELIAQLQTM